MTDLRYTFNNPSYSFDFKNLYGWNIEIVSNFGEIFSNNDLTDCEKYELYSVWSDRSSVFRNNYSSWGTTTRECGCQIGRSEDALWLALESWTSNETSHLGCGENITLWDVSKLTVLNHDTMCGPKQEQCIDVVSPKPCPAFPKLCT